MSNSIDLTPAVLDLNLYSGDGEDFRIAFVDNNQEGLDVSYLSWAAQIRRTRKATTASDLIIDDSNAENGIVMVHIPSEVTRVLAAKNQWDLQATHKVTLEPFTVLQGTVYCSLDVTREDVAP